MKRMGKHAVMVIISGLVLWAMTEAPAQENRPMNLLLITSDDQGPQIGAYGDPYAITPNTDQLAAEGMRFTRAYTTQASCSPARSSILTGLFTYQNGQIGLAGSRPFYRVHDGIPTLPAMLKEAGYRTGIIGKLHVAPESAFPFDYTGAIRVVETRDVRKVARLAGEFLDETGDEPFLLYVNYFDPHRPFDDYANQCEGLPENPYGPEDIEPLPFMRADSPGVLREVAVYYNCIRRLDTGLGLLFDELKRAGKAENTVIIFVGDHGPPFTRAKTTSYEAGERVPFIVKWPHLIQPGSVSDRFVSFVDIMPTLLDAAHIPYDVEQFAGRSLVPVLQNKAPENWRDEMIASYGSHDAHHFYPRRSIRSDRWKLIHNLDYTRANPLGILGSPNLSTVVDEEARQAYLLTAHPPEYELYDLQSDPYELRNLSDQPEYAQVLEQMKKDLHAELVATDDPLLDPAELLRLKKAHDL